MSYKNSNDNPIGIIILIAVAFIMFWVWRFSDAIGAEFEVTFSAVARSSVALILVGLVWYWLKPNPMKLLIGLCVFIWPLWWPVLNSIANNGVAEELLFPALTQHYWWNTDWFKWGVEAVFIVLIICLFVRDDRY